MCLVKYPHHDVVNSVAFNPKDPEMLVTTSDDHTIKVWRSRAKLQELGLCSLRLTKGEEFRKPPLKKAQSSYIYDEYVIGAGMSR